MGVNVKESQNAAIVEIKGRLIDDSLAHEVSLRLHSLLDSGKKNVVVDLGGVDYISSFGFALLISGLKSSREKGGDLKLANISRKAGSLLSTTKMDQVFEEYDTVEKAVNSYIS
jgi:anti-sigma B factor antagonist